MIKIDNVSYSYPKGGGVSNLNLEIKEGEFVFLIGPTGSGKTTILKLIYMDLFPKAGKITVDKYNSQSIKKRKVPYLRRKIGVIFQNYHLLEDRNVFDNIALPLHVLGYDKDEILELVSESMLEVGLEGKESHYPYELSGGEQQRACVARALIKDPDIILADEPTGNLDPIASFELIKLFEQISKEGTSILMASHNYNLIKGRGHRIVEIGCIELENLIPTKNKFHCYLNPERKVSEKAFEIHGYSDEFLSKQKKFKEVEDEFLDFIKGKRLIIHNAEFDLAHLNNELFLSGKDGIKNEIIDM